MLSFDDERWTTLKAHFDNAGSDGLLPSISTLLRAWHQAVGDYAEEYAYSDVRESFLHQNTVLSVAYAVVPHLVSRLDELDPDRARSIASDVAIVEEVRLVPLEQVRSSVAKWEGSDNPIHRHLAKAMVDRHPALPHDLAGAYTLAVEKCREFSESTFAANSADSPAVRRIRRHVEFLGMHGWTDREMSMAIDRMRALDGLVAPLHRGPQDAFKALSGLPTTNQLEGPDDLQFLALHTLAWIPAAVTAEYWNP